MGDVLCGTCAGCMGGTDRCSRHPAVPTIAVVAAVTASNVMSLYRCISRCSGRNIYSRSCVCRLLSSILNYWKAVSTLDALGAAITPKCQPWYGGLPQQPRPRISHAAPPTHTSLEGGHFTDLRTTAIPQQRTV
jgi:hypothetical protein